MEAIHNITVDMVKKGVTPRVYAMQYDTNARVVRVELLSNGAPWNPPEDAAISLSYQKPDGTIGFYSKLEADESAVSVNGNTVTVTLAHQVLTVAGVVSAAIVAIQGNQRIATFPFDIHVSEDPGAGNTKSDDYFNPQATGNAVLYVPQELTPEQKAQARKNLDTLDSSVFRGNLDAAHTNFVKTSANLFDSRRVQNSRYIGKSGYVDGGTYTCSHPIPVRKGVKYRYYEKYITNGVYAYCNPEGTILESKENTIETIDGVVYQTFTADRDGWVVVNTGSKNYTRFMFCEHDSYPAEYVFYRLTLDEKDVAFQVDSKKILHDMGVYTAQNMIDKRAVSAGYLYNGTISASDKNVFTDYIEIIPGVNYAFVFNKGLYGDTYERAVEAYNASKQYLGMGEAAGIVWHTPGAGNTNAEIGVISCENPEVKYVRITIFKESLDTAMMVEGDTYPDEYREYGYTMDNMFRLNAAAKAEVEKLVKAGIADDKASSTTDEIFTVQNMIDPTHFTPGYLSSDGSIVAHTGNVITDYIPVVPGVKYCLSHTLSTYGEMYKRSICLYDENKQFICNGADSGHLTWYTEHSDYDPISAVSVIRCNTAETKYIRVTLRALTKDTAMMVEGDTYPDEYREYGRTLKNDFRLNDTQKEEVGKMLHGSVSPLYGKTAVFDGDSIGHGGSAGDGLSGWAGRIGASNAMTWKNYAVGGGTITQQANHYNIGGNMETIHSEYPKLDYLILEGGTNDADMLGAEGLGTFAENDYSGSYDTATFSGAFETLLYKAVTYYPTAKIGYIVAHNMRTAIRRTYFDRAVEICKKWGVPYIDLWHGAHLNRLLAAHYDPGLDSQGNIAAGKLYTDGQHLTPAGYEVITPKIEAWMKTL